VFSCSRCDRSAGSDSDSVDELVDLFEPHGFHHEAYHDGVVEGLRDNTDTDHSKIWAWTFDAERLMRCKLLLKSVELTLTKV